MMVFQLYNQKITQYLRQCKSRLKASKLNRSKHLKKLKRYHRLRKANGNIKKMHKINQYIIDFELIL